MRNIVRIITETGLRVYKELMPMKKEHWISKDVRPNGPVHSSETLLRLRASETGVVGHHAPAYLGPHSIVEMRCRT